jgi:hypothetical protein
VLAEIKDVEYAPEIVVIGNDGRLLVFNSTLKELASANVLVRKGSSMYVQHHNTSQHITTPFLVCLLIVWLCSTVLWSGPVASVSGSASFGVFLAHKSTPSLHLFTLQHTAHSEAWKLTRVGEFVVSIPNKV